MNYRRIILSIFSLLIAVNVLVMSTGFTVIIHQCIKCDETSITAELYDNISPETETCCCATHSHNDNTNYTELKEDCCKNHVEQLKAINFPPSEKIKILPVLPLISAIRTVHLQAIMPNEVSSCFGLPEKTGGRQIITQFRQLLI